MPSQQSHGLRTRSDEQRTKHRADRGIKRNKKTTLRVSSSALFPQPLGKTSPEYLTSHGVTPKELLEFCSVLQHERPCSHSPAWES